MFRTVLFLFLVFETWYRVYDVFYFFWRRDYLPVVIKIEMTFCFVSIVFICVVIVKVIALTIESIIHIYSNILWAPKLRAIHVLRNSIEKKLLIRTITVCWKLKVLLIRSWILTVLPKELLSIQIHLNLGILLKLIKNVLHIIHYIWNINNIVWILWLLIIILRSSVSVSLLVVAWILTIYDISNISQARNSI